MSKKFVYLLFLLCVFLCSSCRNTDDEIRENKNIAFELITALETFYEDNGQYPNSLDMLEPIYIHNIPFDSNGNEFRYRIYANGEYVLSFDLVSLKDRGCGYLSKYDSWECGPGVSH